MALFGGGGDQKVTTEPPSWLRGYMQDVLYRGQQQANAPPQQYYPGSTVAPQSPYTQQGIQGLGGFGASPFNQQILSQAQGGSGTLFGAANPQQNPVLAAGMQTLPQNLNFLQMVQQRAMGGGGGVGGVNVNPGSPTGMEGLAGQVQDPTSQALQGMLTRTPGQNPYIDQAVSNALGANIQSFQRGFMPQSANASQMAGGYGGSQQGVAEGIAMGDLAQANANTAGQMYLQQLNQDLSNQLQAAGLGGQITAQGSGTGLQRLGQAQQFGLGQEQLAQGAYGQGLQAGQQGFNLLGQGYGQGLTGAAQGLAFQPSLQALGQTGIQGQLGAGELEQGFNQAMLNDAVARFQFNQNAPIEQLQRYAGLIGGLAPAAGQTQTTSGGGTGGLSGIVGGIATGLGALGTLGKAGFTPGVAGAAGALTPIGWGAIGLGILSALGNI